MAGQKNNVRYKKKITDSFSAQTIPIFNRLPFNIRLRTTSKASLKKEFKKSF